MTRRAAIFGSAIGVACLWVAGSALIRLGAPLGITRTLSLPAMLPNHPLNGFDLGLEDREVLLTFDDGPNGWSTPDVLSALDAEHVKATFFMLGNEAQQNSTIARRVLSAGHNVGSHTFSHVQLSKLNDDESSVELQKGLTAIRAALPKSYQPRLFRFPFLDRSTRLYQMSRAAGLTALDADITGDDYTGNSCLASVAKTVWRLDKVGRGIILMHDSKTNSPCVTRHLLSALKILNFRVVQLRVPSSQSSD